MRWIEAVKRYFAARRGWNTPEYYGVLTVSDEVLQATRLGEVVFRAGRDAIARVEIFKREMITVDDICCDIFLEDGSAFRIDEEMQGWTEAIAWLEQLPGFRRDWWNDVVKPPMAECRQTVYVRAPQAYGRRPERRRSTR